MTSAPIWLDFREKGLLRLCLEAKEHTPPVGDIWIGDLSGSDLLAGGVILERKTASDLDASILDGRYKEQRGRLMAYAQAHNVSFGYVIEGPLDQLGLRLSEGALLKHLTRLQLHHKIPVFQTEGLSATIGLARKIAEQLADPKLTGGFPYRATGADTAVALTYNKSQARDDPAAFLIGVLTQCRGVSEGVAKAIQKKFSTLEALMGTSAADLAAIENGKRKIGQAVATRLHGLLHSGGS